MNQIDNIKSFTSDMRFDVVGLTCRMKIPVVAPKGTGGGSGVAGVGAVRELGSNEDVVNIFTTAISF